MRTNLLGLILVVAAVFSATLLVGAAPPPAYDDVSIKFEHWTPEAVVFVIDFSGKPTGAAWEAMLAQGEHVTERQGVVPVQAWHELAAHVEGLLPGAGDRPVRDDEERWVVTFTRAGRSRVARFNAPISGAEKKLVECFDRGCLPGAIFHDLFGG